MPGVEVEESSIIEDFITAAMSGYYLWTLNYRRQVSHVTLAQRELDVDAPYLAIYRATESHTSHGIGDVDLGVKWKIQKASLNSHVPAVAVNLYVEAPTGNTQQELGSGLTDYWLNFIAQELLSERTRINVNLGILFAGNTSTGVVGIETRRGHVLTGGLSMLHDVNARVSVGGEIYGGIADNDGLHRTQLQALLGAQYGIRRNITLCIGLVGGRYAASPRIGAQLGIEVDFPGVLRADRLTRSFSDFQFSHGNAR